MNIPIKVFCTSLYEKKRDGYVESLFYEIFKICQDFFVRVLDPNESDIVFIERVFTETYTAIDKNVLENIKNKNNIVFDYYENNVGGEYIFGKNEKYIKINETEKIYNEFLSKNTMLYFKREMYNKYSTLFNGNIKSIDYPFVHDIDLSYFQPVSYEEYNKRQVDCFMFWGYSNISRPILHGEFMKRCKIQCIDSLIDMKEEFKNFIPNKNIFLSVKMPHYRRVSINEILNIQLKSKISVSLNGVGAKCFRDSESSINSVMAMQSRPVIYAYEWEDDKNCIILPNKENSYLIDEYASIDKIFHYLNKKEDLYRIYLNGVNV